PYRSQSDIPVFDTTVNTLTYDQLYNYNRFSGIDRIGDANQISFGITSRFINEMTGFEKIRLGIGEILYFANRRVTLCNNNTCTDNPSNPDLHRRFSPISALAKYFMNPEWNAEANAIWNPVTRQTDNATITFHYQPEPKKIINL